MDQREQYSDDNPVDGYSTGGDAETIQLDAVEPKKKRGASGGGANDEGAHDIGGTVRDTVQQVQETASNVAGQAQETVGKVADQVRQTASTRLEDQKNRAVEGISNVADTVREMSLSMQDQGAVSEYMDRAAWQLQKVADYLQEKDLRDLAVEVEHFARRQPTMFLAGGFLLGLLGARFLKSSARQLQAQEYAGEQGSSYQPKQSTSLRKETTRSRAAPGKHSRLPTSRSWAMATPSGPPTRSPHETATVRRARPCRRTETTVR